MFCPVHALVIQEVYCSLKSERFSQVGRTVPGATDFLKPRPRFHPKPPHVRFVTENLPTESIYPNSPLLHCQMYVNECSYQHRIRQLLTRKLTASLLYCRFNTAVLGCLNSVTRLN